MNLIPWQPISVLLAIVIGVQAWFLHTYQLAEARCETDKAKMVEQAMAESARREAQYRKAESELQERSAESREKTYEKLRSVTAQRDDLLKRLRIAQDNAATAALMSSSATATRLAEAVTGNPEAELPGSIGVEDVEEASRADTIRLHLEACYEQYDEARRALSP